MKGWEHLKFWKLNETSPDFFHRVYQAHGGSRVFPTPENLYKALELTPYDQVKVVILGQDPYPTKGHAMGLAFSVPHHVAPLPPSLKNIFKEYQDDLGYPAPKFGDLTPWAKEGVLLLNSILTVEEGKPLSHEGIGWEKLTYEILRSLSDRGGIVAVLWGRRAMAYTAALGTTKVINSPHPSPLSASKGFFGSKPFSKANQLLRAIGVKEVNWRLP